MRERIRERERRTREREARARERERAAEVEAAGADDPHVEKVHRDEAETHASAAELQRQMSESQAEHAREHES